MCLNHSKDLTPRKLERGTTNPRVSTKTCLRLAVAAWEADAIISSWPTCPTFASRRVDAITVRTDRLLGREVLL